MIKLYSEGKSICQISKETKICRAYISIVLESEGIRKKRTGKEVKEEFNNKVETITPIVLNMYKANISIIKICDKLREKGYKIAASTIRGILKQNDIPIKPTKSYTKKYKCNEDVFSAYNKFSCYWAGLLAADGCVYKRKDTGNLYIILGLIDKETVYNFKDFIEYTGVVSHKFVKSKFKNSDKVYETETWELRCLNNKLCEDLEKKFNITKHKTYTYSPPEGVPKSLMKYFILGYLDGDGSISYFTTNTGRKQFNITFTGTLETIHYIQHFLCKDNLKIIQRYPERKVNNYTLYVSGNEQLYAILSDLYSDPEINQICMKRKFDKYMLLKKQIEEKKM